MTAHTITPDLARRFPFCNAVTSLTPQDEAYIGVHMRAFVTAEQRGHFRPGSMPGCKDVARTARSSRFDPPRLSRSEGAAIGSRAIAEKARRRFEAYADTMRGVTFTRSELAAKLKLTRGAAGRSIRSMQDRGLIKLLGKAGHSPVYRTVQQEAEE